MNLRSQVALDPNSLAASAFGAGGTPMAVLLNARGQVASEIAPGAEAVLALAGLSQRNRSELPGKDETLLRAADALAGLPLANSGLVLPTAWTLAGCDLLPCTSLPSLLRRWSTPAQTRSRPFLPKLVLRT